MKIGITARFIYEDSIEKQFINSHYLNYINKAGFTPIMLPISNCNLEELLNLCDCFLITGGNDMHSKWYNMPMHNSMKDVSIDMDILDKNVIEYAIKNNKPLLGICRGLQSLNVFLGGTLYQDIIGHKKIENGQIARLNGRGRFFKNILDEEFSINSYHHQAIDKLADDLVSVIEADGIIEAVEHKSLDIYALQWHPERLDDINSFKIINEFAKIVSKKRK